MKELIEYIVKSLVGDKDSVRVEVDSNENETVIHIFVAEEELGRVIGKGGKIASSIRTIAKSTAGRDRRKVFVKFGE